MNLQAANFLDIKPMLDLTCKTLANMIKGKTPEEIRTTFNIENDFTLEEEEQVSLDFDQSDTGMSHRIIKRTRCCFCLDSTLHEHNELTIAS